MAVNIDHKDLMRLERQIYNLTKLVDITTVINSTIDMGRLLTIVMEIIKDIMETEASTLLLFEDITEELVFKVALSDVGEELMERYRVKIGQGVAGWVAENRKAIYINDVYNDPRFDPEFDRKTGFVTKSIMCAPLLNKGKLLGVIQAINPLNRPRFTDEDMRLFNVFANQAALAVQNAVYFQNAIEEERIKSELWAAMAIQEMLVPDIDLDLGLLRLAARSLSAREIGGGFHGLFTLDDGHIGITLGDLNVKGIAGGMNASLFCGGLSALVSVYGKSPRRMLSCLDLNMNELLKASPLASLFYGVIQPDGSVLRFINAGNAFPVLVRDGVSRYIRMGSCGSIREAGNAPVVTIRLAPGDRFSVVSDGIVRLKDRNGREFGLKRVMDFLASGFSDPRKLIDGLVDDAREFTGGLGIREDISIVSFSVNTSE